MRLEPDELAAAATAYRRALSSGDASALEIVGWGELTTALGFSARAGPAVLKWLPPFADEARWRRYEELFHEYRGELERRGVRSVPSELQPVDGERALLAVCVQPRCAAETLGPRVLATADEPAARSLFDALFAAIERAVDARCGLDAQLANWTNAGGSWTNLDLTTPLLRDAAGGDRLDTKLFLAALPAPIRPLVRRFLLRSITSAYHDPRRVALDLLGNLYKERLARWIPLAIEVAGTRVGAAFDAEEIRRHYRFDARLWAALLALRRLDRGLHRHLLRRTYGFLLPGPVER